MPITLPNFSANQPQKGLVSDLSTALEAYMAQKGQDLEHEGQAFKNEGQKYENMYKKEKGLKAEDFVKSEIDRNKSEGAKSALELALLEKFGIPKQQADIDHTKAQTKYYNEGGGAGNKSRYGMSEHQRLWANAPANIKEEMVAEGRGILGPGYDDRFIMSHIANGGSMDELREIARSEGRDPDAEGKRYSTTGASRNTLLQQEGSLAELGVLEEAVTEGMKEFSGNLLLDYSPKQVMHAISGRDDKAQGRFLGARALAVEVSGARTRVAGGSNAHEALKDLREKSLNEIKIFKPSVSKEAWAESQSYINSHLKKALKAKSDYLKGKTTSQELYGDDKSEALRQGQEPSEEDITYTMGKYNVSREEVLNRYKEKQGK